MRDGSESLRAADCCAAVDRPYWQQLQPIQHARSDMPAVKMRAAVRLWKEAHAHHHDPAACLISAPPSRPAAAACGHPPMPAPCAVCFFVPVINHSSLLVTELALMEGQLRAGICKLTLRGRLDVNLRHANFARYNF